MRKVLFALVLGLFIVAPTAARAGIIVEGSLGKGAIVKPDTAAQPLNVMVAPGITLLSSILRLQLGIVGDLPDVKNSKADIGLRPMLTVSPPLFPLYGRLIFAVNNLTHSELRTVAYGGALGISIGLGPIGVFAEAGLLPRSFHDQMLWVIEGRLGASVGF